MLRRCFYSTIKENTEKIAHINSSNIQKISTKEEKKQKIHKETGGPKGPEPTRYGDWEQKGRATDF